MNASERSGGLRCHTYTVMSTRPDNSAESIFSSNTRPAAGVLRRANQPPNRAHQRRMYWDGGNVTDRKEDCLGNVQEKQRVATDVDPVMSKELHGICHSLWCITCSVI
jgi:hypothetical protein